VLSYEAQMLHSATSLAFFTAIGSLFSPPTRPSPSRPLLPGNAICAAHLPVVEVRPAEVSAPGSSARPPASPALA